MSHGPLADLRIIEWGESIPTSYCSKLLGDLGAEVIKIESLPSGDPCRFKGPFLPDAPHPDASALFLYLNTNKYSVTLNLETPTGREILHQLLDQSDFFLEGRLPKDMERLELDYDTLHKHHPKLIVVSLTPFGQKGPYRNYVTSDLVSFQIGGFGNGTPGRGGNPDDPPLRSGGRQADFTQGAYGATGALHGWFCREVDGQGQHVDVSEQAAVASQMQYGRVSNYTIAGQLQNRLSAGMGVGLITCKDGYFGVNYTGDDQWKNWVAIMGDPDWSKDEAFTNEDTRMQNRGSPKTKALIEAWTQQYTKDEIREMAQAKRIPLLPTNTIEEIVQSAQMQARGYFVEASQSSGNKALVPGAPYNFSSTPWSLRSPAPRLGEHTSIILRERLRVNEKELANLRAALII